MKKIKVTVITGGVGGLTWAKSFVKLYDTGRIGRSLDFGYDAVFSIAPYTYQCTIGNWVDEVVVDLEGYRSKLVNVAGIRLDIMEINHRSGSNDLGGSSNPRAFMRVIEKIVYDLCKRGYNVFLYNDDESDSPRRRSIYRRIARKVAKKLDLVYFSLPNMSGVGPLKDKQFVR